MDENLSTVQAARYKHVIGRVVGFLSDAEREHIKEMVQRGDAGVRVGVYLPPGLLLELLRLAQ